MSLTANATTGERWFLYDSDETPTLTSTQFPSTDVAAQAYDSPVQLSRDGTKAFKWIVNSAGTFSRQNVPLARAYFFSYLPLRTPAGLEKAILLDNTGTITIEALGIAESCFQRSANRTRQALSRVAAAQKVKV